MPEKSVTIELSQSAGLVLHDLLARINKQNLLKYEHPSEQRVLWDIECILESTLVHPLDSNYISMLQLARKRVIKAGS